MAVVPDTTIDTVVFDIGGVLIDWNPRHLYRKLLAEEAEMERFLTEVCTPSWNERQDAGRPFAEAVASLIVEQPEHVELIRAYHERWEEMLGGAIEGTVAVLAELRESNVPLYALTNWSGETFPVARRRFPFLEWFDGVVVSGEVGLIKPDPRVFRLLLDRFELGAARCVYIDDSPRNIDVATELGFRALQFRTPEGLRDDLLALGLLPRGLEAGR
jgi:2-haloacid dehalogenase